MSTIEQMLADIDQKINNVRNRPLITQDTTVYGNPQDKRSSQYIAPNKPSSDESLLWKALTGLSSTGKVVTNQLANWTDGALDWNDIPLVESIGHGLKGQKEAWTDGQFGFGDIPGLGFLHGVGQYGKGFGKTLENFGSEKGGKAAGWGGLVGDILLDPLTWMTLGGSSAIKAGAGAAKATAQQAAKSAGVAGKTSVRDLPVDVFDAVKARYVDKPHINPNLVERLAFKKADDATEAVRKSAAATRNKAQNAAFSFDIPFTDITKQFGSKPEFFKIKDKTIAGTSAVAAVSDLLKTLDVNLADPVHAKLFNDALKSKYDASSLDDLTLQGFQKLVDDLRNASTVRPIPDANVNHIGDELIPSLKPLHTQGLQGLTPNQISNLRNYGFVNYEQGSPILEATMRRAVNNPKSITSQISEHVQDMGGSSAFGDKIGKFNPFNPRTFQSTDPLANKAAGDLRDAEVQINGRTRQFNEQLKHLDDRLKDFTADERKAVIYTIEKAFPASFDKSTIDIAKVEEVAKDFENVLVKIKDNDLASGTIKKTIDNYFPHVLSKDKSNLSKEQLSKIIGKSQTNNFGISRTGFDNFAQLDDAVESLQKAGKHEEADELAKLFERDPLQALGYRAYKSIRSNAMSDFYKQMETDGLLVKPPTMGTAVDDLPETFVNAGRQGYHKLSPAEAKAMGLEEGTRIHKDVFEGMKGVQEMFTDAGMNKVVNRINAAVDVWKSLVTAHVPAHYVNNFIGNIANNTLAGVKVDSYSEAGKLIKAMKSGKLTSEQQKIVQAAYDKGVLGTGFSSDFVKSQYKAEKTKLDKIVDNAWARMLRKKGESSDDFSRLALFLHGIKQTGSTDKAAGLVRKYLFNYTERSKADTYARAAMPFWMWTKNNLPLQLRSIIQQPRYYVTYKRVMDAFNADIDKDRNKTYKTESYINLPGTDVGLPTRALPLNDLTHTFGSGGFDPLRSALGMLAPPYKMLPELALNRQFFNNQPVYYKDEEAEGLLRYLKNQTGIVGKTYNILDGGENNWLDILGAVIGKPVKYD